MLMPVQNIEQLLPDLPEQEGSIYVPPMYTKPRAVIPRYRIVSGFLSVLIVMLLLCSGAGYYAKASGKWDAFTHFTGLNTPPSIKPTTAVNIPDPPKTETGPGKDVITSATIASRIDATNGVALQEKNIFTPKTTFYVTYSVVTKGKKGGTITAQIYTDNIPFSPPQEIKVDGDKSQNGSISLNFPASLSGKVELSWNGKLAYRLYFAVREKP
ncbi:hypothetical protein [Ktedonospora formicarum]|nr:hypothetical protein [Ktedonospora formicarum]